MSGKQKQPVPDALEVGSCSLDGFFLKHNVRRGNGFHRRRGIRWNVTRKGVRNDRRYDFAGATVERRTTSSGAMRTRLGVSLVARSSTRSSSI
jgi:hypothetical protein